MKMWLRIGLSVLISALVTVGTVSDVCASQPDETASVQEREETFSRQMKNCVLVGSYTVDGQEKDGPPKAERYEIDSVEKAADNLWIFTARIKYGNLDTKLPITVPVEWAGDTPMVSLTNAALPGLGDGFSARVLFYGDRYAGTWQHGAAGGHMFGRIERKKTAD